MGTVDIESPEMLKKMNDPTRNTNMSNNPNMTNTNKRFLN